MNKETFLLALYDALRGLPVEDKERSIIYYREMIDERVEDGMSEEEAVAALGSVEDIAAEIAAEAGEERRAREQPRTRRTLRAWEIALLVLGSPLWLPLVFAALVVLLAAYIVLWAMVLVCYAVMVSFVAAALAGIAACVPTLLHNGVAPFFLLLGGALVCGGLAVPALFASNAAARGVARLSKRFTLWMRSLFVRKEALA